MINIIPSDFGGNNMPKLVNESFKLCINELRNLAHALQYMKHIEEYKLVMTAVAAIELAYEAFRNGGQ